MLGRFATDGHEPHPSLTKSNGELSRRAACKADIVSSLPEVVDCERLVLRRWKVADAPALSAAIQESLEHLRPWMPWVVYEPLGDEVRAELIRGWDTAAGDDGDTVYGAFLDGVVVGGCGLHRRSTPDTLEIGYWIHVDHTRRGYARELSVALTSVALALPGIARVEIHHDAANTASRRVPEALGFHLDGETPDTPAAPAEIGINVAWSTTPEAWASRPRDLR